MNKICLLRKWMFSKDMLVVESKSVAKICLSWENESVVKIWLSRKWKCGKDMLVEIVKVWQRYACPESESVVNIFVLRKWKCDKYMLVVSITSCLRGSECRSADWLSLPTQQWVWILFHTWSGWYAVSYPKLNDKCCQESSQLILPFRPVSYKSVVS